MYASATKTRSASSTCTASRVEAVLDELLGDLVGLIARDLLTRERAVEWLGDLQDVLVLEAVERFQIKIKLPSGEELALDYEVSDDGSIGEGESCGGFSSHWIPADAQVTLVVRWRTDAPRYEEARRLLRSRGWGPATMLDAAGTVERSFARDGYGVHRRTVGEWQV